MTIELFNITNKYIIQLVDDKNYIKLSEYLRDNFDTKNRCNELNLYPLSTVGNVIGSWIKISNNYEEKLYDIISYAIPSQNIDIIKYFINSIIPSFSRDKNAYSYIELAKDISNDTSIGREIFILLLGRIETIEILEKIL
jgi:hypothetical protein